MFIAHGRDRTLTKVWVQLHRKHSGSLFSKEKWPVTCQRAIACQRLVEYTPKDESLVGLVLVSKKWWCMWVGSKELNRWWIPSEGTSVRKKAQHSLHQTSSSKSHFGREKKHRHAWFELEPWWAFKTYPWNCFFLRNLIFHLLHQIIKIALTAQVNQT